MNSELGWKAADYKKANEEVPGRSASNPDLCEAELMTNEEVQEYVRDCVATLRILADDQSPRLDKVHAAFMADIACLHSFGRIDDDAYNELKDNNLLRF